MLKRFAIILCTLTLLTACGGMVKNECGRYDCSVSLAYKAFGADSGSQTLVIFVHGDSSGKDSRGNLLLADSMHSYAENFASKNNVVAVSLIRPGYGDKNQMSPGSTGYENTRSETFIEANNDAIAHAIRELKAKFKAKSVFAIGHSGGAGVLGVIAGKHPGLLQGVVLVSCPCTKDWLPYNDRLEFPDTYISGIKDTRITLVTGGEDQNTYPDLALSYQDKAKKAGHALVNVDIVNGEGHAFNRSLSSRSVEALTKILKSRG